MRWSFTKILPLLIIVSVLSFSVRLSEVVTGITHLSSTAYAESKEESEAAAHDEEPPADVEAAAGDEMDAGDDTHAEAPHEDAGAKAAEKLPKWRDASDSDFDVSGVKLELFKDLSKRRDALDAMDADLQVREALLKAAQQELERKYAELNKLRGEIESLLQTQSEEEDKRITSLVKIYEGMKPKDAARIFDTLDLDVLLSVISKMSERKASPILAAMNPERVRTVTIMLAEQKKLPSL